MADENSDESKAPTPEQLKHLAWAIEHRGEVQQTLFALYRCIQGVREPYDVDSHNEWNLINCLIGAAFSLWRAVFLADLDLSSESILASQNRFLKKLIEDNSILYPDDKKNRSWVVCYYVENASYRLRHGAEIGRKLFELPTPQEFEEKYLDLPWFRQDAPITRWNLEASHYVLRVLLKGVFPDIELEPREPPEFIDDDLGIRGNQ